MNDSTDVQTWREVLDFWFPEGRSLDVDAGAHGNHWSWRLHGGADDTIVARFSDLTTRAAAGDLDGWTAQAEGRLALIIVLDQFSRSLWRGSARAFAQDPAALALAMQGLSNGHYAALSAPWYKIVYSQPLGHCEGPDHLERVDRLIRLREAIAADAPVHLQPTYHSLVKQAHKVRGVIAAFGRHPHRNPVLGRPSSAAEDAYIAKGEFPHVQALRD